MPRTDDAVVLIDDDPARAALLGDVLVNATDHTWTLDWHRTVPSAVARLSHDSVRTIFLNLALCDSPGLDTLRRLLSVAPTTPLIVLGGVNDDDLCRAAMSLGAADYLLEGHIDRYSLAHALRHVQERDAVHHTRFIEQERAQVTLNSIGDAVISVDLSNQVTFLNAVAERMTGWSCTQALGHPVAEVFQIVDGASRLPIPDPLALVLQLDQTVALSPNCVLIRRDGQEAGIEDSAAPIHDRDGAIIGAVIVFRDVSMARKLALDMAHLAQHDVLTGLPNRVLLKERLNRAILLAKRNRTALAVLFLDLDGFKRINDSLGHAIGDSLLQSVAARLSAGLRESDTVSRLGGDEFVILLTAIARPEHAAMKAERLLTKIRRDHTVGEHQLRITASIGISTYPDDGADAEALLTDADMAMYVAKAHGRDRVQRFAHDMRPRAAARQSLEGQLRCAVEGTQLLLHYQPKVDLRTGLITSVEALVRWQHPGRGLLLPGQFLAIAEDSGIITAIDKWVLHEACRQTREWLDAGVGAVPVAVNVSSLAFGSERFAEGVAGALKRARLRGRYLEIELTETALMTRAGAAASALAQIHALGVRLALDDFGTGYSSLSYLTRFTVDALKIDRSFVHGINRSEADTLVATAIISLAKRLHHRVIAEGVETPDQLAFLQAQGCDEAQGYYFGRPMVAEEFGKLLALPSEAAR